MAENAYRDYLRDLLLSRTRIYAVVAMVLVPLFSLLDFLTQPHSAVYFLGIRVSVAATAALVFLASKRPAGPGAPLILSFIPGGAAAIAIQAMIVHLGARTSPYYAGECLVNLASGLLLPWNFRVMVGFSLFQLLIYVVPAQLQPGPIQGDYINNLFFLVSTMVISCWACYFTSEIRQREFRLRHDLEAKTRALDQASRELEASLRQVREFDRLKTQFFANMSHELRTPLTLMLPPLEDLSGNPRYALSGEVKSLLEIMTRNGKRLLRLINQLLDLSRLDAGKMALNRERSNLGRLLGEVAARFKPFAEGKGLSLSTELTPVLDSLFDQDRMELVIQNLLSNAVKFTPPEGKVTVRLRSENKGHLFEVQDTGIGVRPQDKERIFDRFAQADGDVTRQYGGTGIGLALAKELVELHGGRITMESEPGRGSCFKVWVPSSMPQGPAKAADRPASEVIVDWESNGAPAAPRPAGPAGRPTVLVIDDNGDLRSLLRTTLEPQFRVELAKDGEEGLAAARKLLPDVIISDVMMPGKSGNDVARELKADPRTGPIPLILLTAKLDAGAIVEGLSAGADDYVRKPFSPPELISRIRGQIRLRALMQKLMERSVQNLLGSVAEGVGHEINNPLAVIMMELDRLLRAVREGAKDRNEMEKWVAAARTHVDRIARVVEGLCAIAGKGRGNDQVEIRRMVEDVTRLVGPKAMEAGVTLESGEIPEDWWIKGNGADLRRALLNVALNAVEAASRGASEKKVRVEARLEGGQLRLEVADTGPGIPPDIKERVFQPFFTTKEPGEGLGLGLSVTKSVVEGHGGRLRLESAPGRTVLTLSLPGSGL